MTDKIGRNAPCPCGSGKKYKHCCIGISSAPSQLKEDLARAVAEHGPLETFEDAQRFAQQFMDRRNETPVEDFHGLTPSQMHTLLHGTFGEGSVITLAHSVQQDNTPIMKLFRLLATVLVDKRVKATATGNLPRAICRDITREYLGDEEYAKRTQFGDIQSEPNACDLHKTRIIAEIGKLIELERGYWKLTNQGLAYSLGDRKTLCYPYLVANSFLAFNWAYEDRYGDYQIIQQSIGYTLYLLSLFGSSAKPAQFYADAMIRAFPGGLAESQPYLGSREEEFSRCYFLRCLDHILVYVGLISVEGRGNFSEVLPSSTVRCTEAFRQLIGYRGVRR